MSKKTHFTNSDVLKMSRILTCCGSEYLWA